MNRRTFMKSGVTAISHAALLRSFGSLNALAQSAGSANDYKALVCVFLFGGNDSNNMLIPMDSASLGLYAKNRGQLALAPGTLLPLAGGNYAVHPSMPNVQAMYGAGNLAFLANVGSLVAPVTQSSILNNTAVLPGNLMSHPDQVTLMQSALSSSSQAYGWAGAIADAMPSGSQTVLPMCTSVYGNQAFIEGRETSGFLSPGQSGSLFCSFGKACSARVNGNSGLLATPENNVLVAADQKMIAQTLALNTQYGSILSQAPALKTVFASDMQTQFKTVTQMIQMRQAFGAQRQIFFVGLGSFDTHQTQLDYHASMLGQLDNALQVFAAALQEIGLYNNVTTFTLSDFGRTLQGNGAQGSDHAWGSHHMVMGGAVKGGRLYGTYPSLDPNGPDDNGDQQGRWIPTTSVSQMGATLATWFGTPQASLSTVFPYLSQFPGGMPAFL